MSWLRLMEEKIKETGSAEENKGDESAAEMPGKEVPKTTAGKKHRVRELIRDMWPAYLIEILVIILGISITLALEEWRDHSKEKELETIYQKNLLSDIEVDLQSLKYTIGSTQQIISKGEELLAFINSPREKPISPGQAEADLRQILQRPKFISSDATFSDLKSSGNLHLLKDLRLKNLLFAYYNMAQNIKEVQDAEQQATIVISGAYFLKRVPLSTTGSKASPINDQSLQTLAGDIEFRNNVILRVDNRRELLIGYQKADSLVTQVRRALSAVE